LGRSFIIYFNGGVIHSHIIMCVAREEFEDTKGVIRIRKSKKNRQQNGQKKGQKDKQQSTNIHIKLKIK